MMDKEEAAIQRSCFASDNNAGVHPEILASIYKVNSGHVLAYGDDPFTKTAIKQVQKEFGTDGEVFFVFNGTGANVSALATVTRPFQAIICPRTAHINVDECSSPERFIGCKLIDVDAPYGKITPAAIDPFLSSLGDEHQAQPKVVSITQATELGTVYRPEEIRILADYVHRHGMFLHMDGARLANAAAFLGCSLRDLTGDCGVDMLSFGGTKNGLMYGEAVIFFDQVLARDYRYTRKQTTQLASKMRYIAVQFERLLEHELWRENALHANRMAALLADLVRELPDLSIAYPVEANAVFVKMPKESLERLRSEFFFYITEDSGQLARWMTSFDTREEDVRRFGEAVAESLRE
ncbi:MAG: low specificity L-threonine aldolase [Methanospirillum sp.]|nr:low specificity L-threonine aldolase [Methanospirillum sp.]